MTTKENIVAFRLPEAMIEELNRLTIEEGFKTRSDLLYRITFDYLKNKSLEKQGRRFVVMAEEKDPNK